METGNLSEDYRPLILVAEDDDSNFKLIMAAGASEVLVKPITLSALRTCLSKFLPRLQW